MWEPHGYVPHWHNLKREAFRHPSLMLPKDTCATTPTGASLTSKGRGEKKYSIDSDNPFDFGYMIAESW